MDKCYLYKDERKMTKHLALPCSKARMILIPALFSVLNGVGDASFS